MRNISINAFQEVLHTEKSNPTVDFINVCTPAEYSEKHIEGVRSVPLDELQKRVKEFEGKNTIYVHCRSGRRGAKAAQLLESLGVKADVVNVEGGTVAWEEAGLKTGSTSTRMPLMRQVFLAAGILVFVSSLLAIVVHPYFAAIALFSGTGFIISGATGWCGMAMLLARMPYNNA